MREPTAAGARRVRLAMIGGGPGSNIGETHRYAAHIDGRYELVAGVFGRDPQRSAAFAAELGLPPERSYPTWAELAAGEAARPDGAEVVTVVTPNASHFEIVAGLLEGGLDVICDKPLTTEPAQAHDLLRRARAQGRRLAVTYNYSGYPMVREARERVRSGLLGEVRLVQVEHASGWASTLLEEQGHKQAAWRTDPAQAGPSTVVGDLGTHAHHLVRFVTGLDITEVSAELSCLVPGRMADDNGHLKLRLSNGARGLMWVSMVAAGHLHGLRLRVYGERGSLEWVQETPEELIFRPLDGPRQVFARGAGYLSPLARRSSRLWPGHPEGFLEAFTNLYTDLADTLLADRDGRPADPLSGTVPMAEDGVLGVEFVAAAVASDRRDGAWTPVQLALEPAEVCP